MALSNIFGWNKEDEKDEKQAGTACGTACGASDEQPEENKQPAVQHVEHLTSKKFI